jgi:hypothetical protein
MVSRSAERIVVLGMMSKKPVAGIAYITMQYVLGLHRLGFDVYYVEAHGCTPTWFTDGGDDGSLGAANFIDSVMRRYDLGDRWAFQALHSDSACYGLSDSALREVYRSAAWILNLHGGTVPQPEHYDTGRLVYVGTDPVGREIEIAQGVQNVVDLLAPHCCFFTWGENHGNPDCLVPVSSRFHFIPTRQPIVLDLWERHVEGPRELFTTVGNWRQANSDIVFEGRLYTWSKHVEFARFLDLPSRCGPQFELALSGYDEDDRRLLEAHGWRVRNSMSFSTDLDAYGEYIASSRGEFTVAKEQNVRLRSGWFSDRSASYLASGRPVVTQETGFSNILPAGDGLFGFSTVEDAADAIETINGDYEHHCRAALEIARECFDYRVVLERMLAELGTGSRRVMAG